jgi:hypothetical protein
MFTRYVSPGASASASGELIQPFGPTTKVRHHKSDTVHVVLLVIGQDVDGYVDEDPPTDQ